jgi:hypothetical protein
LSLLLVRSGLLFSDLLSDIVRRADVLLAAVIAATFGETMVGIPVVLPVTVMLAARRGGWAE